jgi:hypothetical protein
MYTDARISTETGKSASSARKRLLARVMLNRMVVLESDAMLSARLWMGENQATLLSLALVNCYLI